MEFYKFVNDFLGVGIGIGIGIDIYSYTVNIKYPRSNNADE